MPSKFPKKIMALIFVTCLIIAAVPGEAWGEAAYTIVGETNGLKIEIPAKTVDTGNLNPDDQKQSHFRITNTGSETLTLYIRTNIVSEEKPNGGQLADAMTLTIKDGETVIASNVVRNVANAGNIQIGPMGAGTMKTIYLATDLPGSSTGNDYQAAYLKLNWTFTAQAVQGGGGDSGGSDSPGDPQVFVPMGSIPEGPPVIPSDSEIEIVSDEIPMGPPIMPKTGEDLPVMPYLLGLVAVGAGVKIVSKKSS